MSVRSKKPSHGRVKATTLELKKPFDLVILRKAAALAERYTVIVGLDDDAQPPTYVGRTLELPLVMADGVTRAACMEQVIEATRFAIAAMLEAGDVPPQPATDDSRTAQINIRLTQREKFCLEAAAKRAGFRGLSDFVRTAALDRAS
jgi:predicted RNase H-like HicB family nuclease